MSCASPRRPDRGRRRAGFSFTELLIAVAITSVFALSIYVTFSQVLTAHDEAEARMEAVRNGRTALATLSDELKAINRSADEFLLVGFDVNLAYGDGRDNDLDNSVDEELVNGINDDQTTDSLPVLDAQRHARIGNLNERPLAANRYDLGDFDVDEDTVFGRDVIIFRILPRESGGDILEKTVTLAVTEFDGEENVLVRQTNIERAAGEPLVGQAPLAFGVLGFDLLYWNPNAEPRLQGWQTSWDSTQQPNFDPPRLPLPASIYVKLTLDADRSPIEAWTPGEPRQTLVLETIVNVEETIGDIRFPRPLL